MSWRVVDRVTVYHEAGMYALAPTVTRTPGGDLLVGFQRAPHLGYDHHEHPLFQVIACRSRDDGRTWSEAALLTADPMGGVMDRGLHALPDGSLFLHASCNELVPAEGAEVHGQHWISRPGKPFWVRSRDDGRTWTAPRRFPPLPDAIWGHPAQHSGVCRSGLLVLPDGRLLLPSKATDRPGGAYPCFGMLRVSRDMGETWEYGGRIAEDDVAHFSEPAIHRTPSGASSSSSAATRGPWAPASSGTRASTDPSRGTPSSPTASWPSLQSDDDGATWTPWRPTRIHGSPAHLLGLRDGRIFLTARHAVGGPAGLRRPGPRPRGHGPGDGAGVRHRGRRAQPGLRLPLGRRARGRLRPRRLLAPLRRRPPRHRGRRRRGELRRGTELRSS